MNRKAMLIISIIVTIFMPILLPVPIIILINNNRMSKNLEKLSFGKSVLTCIGTYIGVLVFGIILVLIIGTSDTTEEIASSTTNTEIASVSSVEITKETDSFSSNNTEEYSTNEAAYIEEAFIDEAPIIVFHEIYEKYSPKSDENIIDYFGRAYGDMLEDAYAAGQGYDQFEGKHNDIAVTTESEADTNTYDYEELMNYDIPDYNSLMHGNYNADSFIRLRVDNSISYDNTYVLTMETNEKYKYDIDAPVIGFFSSNPISITNISDYDLRHLEDSIEVAKHATIIGKVRGVKNIDGQDFPIIEIYMARSNSIIEDEAIKNGKDLDAKYTVINNPTGSAIIREIDPYIYDLHEQDPTNNEIIQEVPNGSTVYINEEMNENEEIVPVTAYGSDGSVWYAVSIQILRAPQITGWVLADDIGEDYIY